MSKKLILFLCVLMAGCGFGEKHYACLDNENSNISVSLVFKGKTAIMDTKSYKLCYSKGNRDYYAEDCLGDLMEKEFKYFFRFDRISERLWVTYLPREIACTKKN